MFINNINPVLLKLGIFEIRYYGLVYVFGFLLVYFLLRHYAKKGKIKNLTEDRVDSFVLWEIIFIILGARIFAILSDVNFYFSNPLEMLMVWHGGMAFHGGLIFGVITALIFCRKYKIEFYDIADAALIPTALILAFGRIANFLNSELYGYPANVPWCVVFEKVDNLCRHPSQIYESLKNFFIFFVLLFMKNANEKKKKFRKGTLFWVFVLLYGLLRFIITFWRDDPRYFGLSFGQYLSLGMFIVAGIVLLRMYFSKKKSI